jgi:hypothetical protein
MWAQRVIARRGQPAHVLLELPADATAEDAQGAFHKVARTSHPDLHRHGLTAEEIEMVTSAYAAVAGAYQELRTRTMPTTSMKKIARAEEPPPTATPPGGSPVARPSTTTPAGSPPIARPASPPPAGSPAAPGGKPEGSMSPKALTYYRKAEIALRRGDLKGAILQLKLACATDPTSTFLRTALAEVETEVRKST